MEKIKYKNMDLLPPKSDIVFKAVFGSEECKDVLCAFLTDVLEIEIPDFKAIELINNEFKKEHDDDKLSRMDIRIKTGNNQNIDIEIQLLDNRNMIPRSIYYTSKLFATQMTEGMKYNELGRAITLVILDYKLFKDEKMYYNCYRFKNRETNTELTDLIEISYLELEKFSELVNVEGLSKLQLHELTNKEKWAVFLTTQSEEVLQMLAKENDILNKAVNKLVFVSAEEKLRYEYEQRQKAIKDHYCDIEDAREEGKMVGKLEGKIEGKEEKAKEIAANLLDVLDDQLISLKTGLSIENIKLLRQLSSK